MNKDLAVWVDIQNDVVSELHYLDPEHVELVVSTFDDNACEWRDNVTILNKRSIERLGMFLVAMSIRNGYIINLEKELNFYLDYMLPEEEENETN